MYLLQGQETERLLFRKIRPEDESAWLPFFQDPTSFLHWNQVFESPEIECKKWFANQFKRLQENRGGMNSLIDKESRSLIGYCGVLVQFVDGIRELEIAYSLLPQYRGVGYATEAAKKCRDFAFQNDFAASLISIISKTNTASSSVALKNGMEIEKQTVYKGNDVNIFRITKDTWKQLPNGLS